MPRYEDNIDLANVGKIINHTPPTNPGDGATKNYVDTSVSAEVTRAETAESAIRATLAGLAALPWVANTSYAAEAIVTYAGSLWQAPSGGVPARMTFTASDWTQLATIGSLAPVQSVAGRTGIVVLAESDITNLATDLAAKAPLASPTFTGSPLSTTAPALNNSTQIATTAYVDTAVAVETTRAQGAETTNAASISTESTRAVTAELLLAPKASPTFTGLPNAPTASALTNNSQIATTAYTDSAVSVEKARAQGAETTNAASITSETSRAITAESNNATTISTETTRAEAAEALLAPKASPTLTGTPLTPTATPLTSSTQIASTAYADAAVAVEKTRALAAENTIAISVTTETTRAEGAEALLAPLVSPHLTGTPLAPTASPLTNTTQLATTAYADAAVAVEKTRALGAENTIVTSVTAETTRATTAEGLLAPLASPTFTGTVTTPVLKVTGGTPATGKVLTSDSTGGATWQPATTGSTTLAADTDVVITSPANAQVLTYNSGTSKWNNEAIPNATTSATGLIELAGDLAGTATAPTLASTTNVNSIISSNATVTSKAPLASPALTGSPTAPTQTALDNSIKLATTAYTDLAVGVEKTRATTAEGLLSPLASPTFTGTVTTPALKVTGGTPGVGKVLTSDSSGGATWGAVPTTTLAGDTDVSISSPTNGQVLTYNTGTSKWDNAAPPTAANATTSTPGLVQLAGDLGGTSTTATAPTLAATTNVNSIIAANSTVTSKAPLASPALTGTPTTPTATALTNTTQIASTAYTDSAVSVEKTRALAAEALLAPLASPHLTGVPQAPTASALTNNTQIATTAYTDSAVAVLAASVSRVPAPTGVASADFFNISQAITAVGGAGTVVLQSSGTNYNIGTNIIPITTGLRLVGQSKYGSTIVGSGTSIFSFPTSGVARFWELSDMTVRNSVGHIFNPTGTVQVSAFVVQRVSLQTSGNSGSIWSQSAGVLVEAYFYMCDLESAQTTPAVPAFNLNDSGGQYNSNVWEKCVCAYNVASTQYFFNWICASGSSSSYANTFRDIVFETCLGGCMFLQGHESLLMDSVQCWDNDSLGAGNSTADLFHVGKASAGLSSRSVKIVNGSRFSSALGTGFYDISLDASTQQFIVDNYRASPDNGQINLNSGGYGTILNQSPGTTIVNGTGTPSQFVGAGNPNSNSVWTARVGDLYLDQSATSGHTFWRCTTLGNPGVWTGL